MVCLEKRQGYDSARKSSVRNCRRNQTVNEFTLFKPLSLQYFARVFILFGCELVGVGVGVGKLD